MHLSLAFLVWALLPLVSQGVSRNRTSRRAAVRRQVRQVKEGVVRLMGGQTPREGNVEIYHLGTWGSICDDEWDLREANIACRSLGFPNATRATHNSEFGRGRSKSSFRISPVHAYILMRLSLNEYVCGKGCFRQTNNEKWFPCSHWL